MAKAATQGRLFSMTPAERAWYLLKGRDKEVTLTDLHEELCRRIGRSRSVLGDIQEMLDELFREFDRLEDEIDDFFALAILEERKE